MLPHIVVENPRIRSTRVAGSAPVTSMVRVWPSVGGVAELSAG